MLGVDGFIGGFFDSRLFSFLFMLFILLVWLVTIISFSFSLPSTVAYLNLGTSLVALGRCHEAASVLRDGAKLDGSGLRDRSAHDKARISSLLQLGGLYVDQGKLQRALAVYKEALHTLPSNYPPQVRLRISIITLPESKFLSLISLVLWGETLYDDFEQINF